jgi:hypothetical protein
MTRLLLSMFEQNRPTAHRAPDVTIISASVYCFLLVERWISGRQSGRCRYLSPIRRYRGMKCTPVEAVPPAIPSASFSIIHTSRLLPQATRRIGQQYIYTVCRLTMGWFGLPSVRMRLVYLETIRKRVTCTKVRPSKQHTVAT